MAMIRCDECENFIDDDWHPCEEVNGVLVCPSCADELRPEPDTTWSQCVRQAVMPHARWNAGRGV